MAFQILLQLVIPLRNPSSSLPTEIPSAKQQKQTNMSEIPTFTGFYLVLLGFTSFYLRLPACTGCYCIFTEIDQILPGCCVFLSIFTGFYLDSPGLTGFYCVFTEIFQL